MAKSSIERGHERLEPRYMTRGTVLVTFFQGKRRASVITGNVENVSKVGMRVRITLPPGAEMTIVDPVRLEVKTGPLRGLLLAGKVVRIVPTGLSAYSLGLDLFGASDQDLRRLNRAVNKIAHTHLPPRARSRTRRTR